MTLLELPEPDPAGRAHSGRVLDEVRRRIAAAGGWIPFTTYMHSVLYAAGLGYYVAGARKFGAAGDFVTGPELSPLYAQALAVQVGAIVESSGGEVLELGAGSGVLAAGLIASLASAKVWVTRYRILEVSPELRERQRESIGRIAPALLSRFEWIEALPDHVGGAVILNEVLDALPVNVVASERGQWLERGVGIVDDRLAFVDRPLQDEALRALAEARFPKGDDYSSEINRAAEALIEDLGGRLAAGAILAIDYGFLRREYYHPQRATGTLMGHYRHRAHADPFLWPGLSDLTTHVDFTAMAEAGVRAGLEVAGFTSQAAFLVGCGILDRLRAVGPPESSAYLREASAVQTLLSPAEMGELFKVLALARGDGIAWPGFAVNDRRQRL